MFMIFRLVLWYCLIFANFHLQYYAELLLRLSSKLHHGCHFDLIGIAAGSRSFCFQAFTAYDDVWSFTLQDAPNLPRYCISGGKFYILTWDLFICEDRERTSVWAGSYVRQWSYRIYLCLHYLGRLYRTGILYIRIPWAAVLISGTVELVLLRYHVLP